MTGQIPEETSPEPIEAFYPRLALMPSIQAALKMKYGKASAGLLQKLLEGAPFDEGSPEDVEDFIHDQVHQNAVCVHSIEAMAADEWDSFDIDVMHYGPLFFIQANEYDDIGFFETLEMARNQAEGEWCDQIEARAEYLEEEGDEE